MVTAQQNMRHTNNHQIFLEDIETPLLTQQDNTEQHYTASTREEKEEAEERETGT